MAVRKRLYHPDEVRQKIRTSQLVNRLNQFALGKLEMSKAQVSAAVALLRKTMPDLTAVEHSGRIDTRSPSELSDAELADIAARGRAGVADASRSPAQPGGVH